MVPNPTGKIVDASRLGSLGPDATTDDNDFVITTQHVTNGPIVEGTPLGMPAAFDPARLLSSFINDGEVHVAVHNNSQTNFTNNEDSRQYTIQVYKDQRRVETTQQVLNIGMGPALHAQALREQEDNARVREQQAAVAPGAVVASTAERLHYEKARRQTDEFQLRERGAEQRHE